MTLIAIITLIAGIFIGYFTAQKDYIEENEALSKENARLKNKLVQFGYEKNN